MSLWRRLGSNCFDLIGEIHLPVAVLCDGRDAGPAKLQPEEVGRRQYLHALEVGHRAGQGEDYFGRIEIPVEEVVEKKSVKVKDKKTGETTYQEKKVTRKRKKFQGYLFAEPRSADEFTALLKEGPRW